MPAPTNHYKLGLFVILGFAVAILAGILLGGARLQRSVIQYHSYFNESVQGLDRGAPVKFRGVTIGHVSAIEIAPDHRMVDVVSELDTKEVIRMGLTEAGRERGSERFALPTDLRTQLNSQGITGVKFVAVDFFDVKNNPPPNLPFPVPDKHYIPAAQSMMKNMEGTITSAMDRLPEMVDAVVQIMARIDGLFATLEEQDVSGKFVVTLEHANALMTALQTAIERIDRQDLGNKAASTITELNSAAIKMNALLDRLGDKKGLVASAQHAADTFGELGRAGNNTQKELDETLRDVSEAAEAIRTLVSAIERDPDMFLKGKTKREGDAMRQCIKHSRVIVFLVASAAFASNACALLSKSELVEVRYFSPERADSKPVAESQWVEPRKSAPDGPLEVRLGRVSSGSNLRERIAYRNATFELGYYEDLRWVEHPETFVRRELGRALFEVRGLRRVLTGAAPTLEVEVTAFDDLRLNTARAARVQLKIILYEDNGVIFENTLTVDRPVAGEKPKIEDVVAAMAIALDSASEQVALRVEKALVARRAVSPTDTAP